MIRPLRALAPECLLFLDDDRLLVVAGTAGFFIIPCGSPGRAEEVGRALIEAATSGEFEAVRYRNCPCGPCLSALLAHVVPEDLRPDDADDSDPADWWKAGGPPPEFGAGGD